MTPVQTGDDQTLPRRMRTFEEIMSEEREKRNILTVTLTKIVKYVDGKEERPASLTMEDIGEFIFGCSETGCGRLCRTLSIN